MQRRDSGPTSSLFERIREAANPPSYQNTKEALIRSIRRNLRQVLIPAPAVVMAHQSWGLLI